MRGNDKVIARAEPGLACVAAGCNPDFYTGHAAVSADAAGAVTYLYDAATTFEGKHFQLKDARLEPKPLQEHLPLVIGGAGEAGGSRNGVSGTGSAAQQNLVDQAFGRGEAEMGEVDVRHES